MADIYHTFIIKASPEKIFDGISTSQGLDRWWTKSSEAQREKGGTYMLDFGPPHIWKAVVSRYLLDKEIEWDISEAEPDWLHTKVGFILNPKGPNKTETQFYHTGWSEITDGYKYSCYCWAMYLRVLKRYLEFGELVPYDSRLAV